MAQYAMAHKLEKKEYDRAYYLANKARKDAQSIAWKKSHPEIISESGHRRYLKHKPHILAVNKKWKHGNPHKVNAMAAKRRAALLQATPLWLSRSQWLEIENIYLEANKVSKQTGQPHHVDHIVPLQGQSVSGLHVPWNLQILLGHDNLTKSRKFENRRQ